MTESKKPRLAILISGTGSNMEAIMAACDRGDLLAEIALIVSDQPEARGVQTAKKRGIETFVSPYEKGVSRQANELPIVKALQEKNIDWIVLAGYMKILSSDFVRTFPGRIVNIHPSLLPAFPGAHAIRDVLEGGADYTGVTIHIVDELVDHGPILAQEEVPIYLGDKEESLAIRIHEVEHRLYPRTLQQLLHEDV